MATPKASNATPKRVLVTGATGLIGLPLCNALIGRGDEVVGLSRNAEKAAQAQPKAEWHTWEPTMERPPDAALEGIDAIINLAGEPVNQRWNDEVKDKIARSRIKATKNLVQAVKTMAEPPSTFISGSAIGYYGNRGDELLYEDAEPGNDFLAGVVKDWEAAAKPVASDSTRLVVLRTGHVLDFSGGLLGELLTPFKLGVGGPIGSGKQYMSWIHRNDEIGIIQWALDNEKVDGIYNSTAPNPVTNKEFAKQLGKAVSRPAVIPTPGFALNLIRGSEMSQVIREGQRVYPRKALDDGYEFKQPELAGALANLLRK